jgi:peroxiredoxin
MGDVMMVVRLALAAVFAIAAVGKLADRAGSRQALRDFGVPARLGTPLATGLPLAELAVAGALIAPATAWWGGLGALALLLWFLAAIAVNLRRGRTPPCHCFGRLHSAPAGPTTLVRTAALAILAGALVAAGRAQVGPSAVGWTDSLSRDDAVELALGLTLLAGLLAGTALFLQVIAQSGRLMLRIEALEARLGSAAEGASAGPAALAIGAPAPPFTLDDVDGRAVSLDELRAAGKPVVLVFSDPHCGPCRDLLPELVSWQRDHAAEMTLAVVSRGTPEAHRETSNGSGPRHVLLQRDREVAQAYRAHATPTAVLVGADGTIGSPPAPGAGAIGALVARTALRSASPYGRSAPPIRAPSSAREAIPSLR